MEQEEFTACLNLDREWRQRYCSSTEAQIACRGITYLQEVMDSVSRELKINQTPMDISNEPWLKYMATEECDMTLGIYALHAGVQGIFQVTPSVLTAKVAIFSAPQTKTPITSVDVNIQVLLVIILSGLIIALLTYLTEKFRRFTDNERNRRNTFGEVLWIYFAAIFLEGIERRRFNNPSLILHTTWFLALTILLAVIGGNMKADLATAKNMEMNDLNDLERRPDILPIFTQHSNIASKFWNSDNPTEKAIMKRATEKNGTIPFSEIVNHLPDVVAGKSVIIEGEFTVFGTIYLYYNKTEPRPKLHVSEALWYAHHCFSFNDYVPATVVEIYRQKAAFIAATAQFIPRLIYSQRYSSNEEEAANKASSYNILIVVLNVYFVGMSIAAIVLLIEIMINFLMTCMKTPDNIFCMTM